MKAPPLRPYQVEGIDFLAGGNRLLADYMGAGKSAQAILALERTTKKKPALIVCPVSALEVWVDELALWAPVRRVLLYRGTPTQRHTLRGLLDSGEYDRVVTNYEMVKELSDRNWAAVIFDESHKLRSRRTQRYGHARTLLKKADRTMMLTGTPIVRHPVDLVPQVMLLTGERSYWRIVEQYFRVDVGEWGWEIGGVKDQKALRAYLGNTVLRRERDELLPGLPAKVVRHLHVEPTARQQKAYDQIVDDLFLEADNGQVLLVPSVLAQITRLRQLLVEPRLLGLNTEGAATKLAREIAADCADAQEQLVVFTPFAQATPYLAEALRKGGLAAGTVTGATSRMKFKQKIAAFQAGDLQGLVCTVQISEGFSLNRARRVLFIGSDWNASANEQAEARIHRPGVGGPVMVEYIVHRLTIEQHVLDVVGLKKWHEQRVLGRANFYGGTA